MHRRIFLIGLLFPAQAYAHSTKAGDIMIGHSWALPTTQHEGQAFFPLVNNGRKADELIAARSQICSLIELRQNNRYDDPPLKSIVLEPGKPVPMRPKARHIRLLGLNQPLEEFDTFKMVLDFLNQGEVEIDIMVEASASD
jgi:copper(I)-binding protein